MPLFNLVVALLAAQPDVVVPIRVPGGGPVSLVTFQSTTFSHTVGLPGPIGGPSAGADLVALISPGGTRVILEGALYSQSQSPSTTEPYASLKKKKVTARAAPDGSRIAYSYDGEKTWRVLLLDPIAACRHVVYPTSAAALSGPAEAQAAAILRVANHGNGGSLDSIESESREGDADEKEAFAWAVAHPSPTVSKAAAEWLALPGNFAKLRHGRFGGEELAHALEAVAPLREAAAGDAALRARVIAAAKAEAADPESDDAPGLLAHVAGLAPAFVGHLAPSDGGTVRVFARLDDGGYASQPATTSVPIGGRFELFGLDAGEYLLACSAPGFESSEQRITVPQYNHWVTLRPAKTLSGTLLLPDGGPLAQAALTLNELSARAGGERSRAETLTDARGRFSISSWAGGAFRLSAAPKGARHCYEWNTSGRPNGPLDLRVPAERLRLRFVHVGQKATPAGGVEVTLWADLPFGWAHAPCAERRAVTDAKGAVEFEPITSDRTSYRVRLRAPGRAGAADGGTLERTYSGPSEEPYQVPLGWP